MLSFTPKEPGKHKYFEQGPGLSITMPSLSGAEQIIQMPPQPLRDKPCCTLRSLTSPEKPLGTFPCSRHCSRLCQKTSGRGRQDVLCLAPTTPFQAHCKDDPQLLGNLCSEVDQPSNYEVALRDQTRTSRSDPHCLNCSNL